MVDAATIEQDLSRGPTPLLTYDMGSTGSTGSGPEATARAILKTLEGRLDEKAAQAARFDDYYQGNHPLPEIPFRSEEKATYYRRKYLELLKKSRTNWMGLVIDAVGERLKVEGFRFGDEPGDKEAWAMWQANNLDAESEQVHTEALKSGEAYVSVWFGPDGEPLITPEHPSQVIVTRDPSNRRVRSAALKRWTADDGTHQATLWLPGFVWKFHKRAGTSAWTPRQPSGEEWPMVNRLGVVPIVAFPNRPDMLRGGVSEIAGVTPIQDRINATVFGRMLAAELTVGQKRWITGVSMDEDPVTGKPLPPDFDAALDNIWMDENPDAKFGAFPEVTLAGFISAVEADVIHLAAITRTPRHYLIQSGQSPSGDAIKSAETGLVAKVRRQHLHFGESWEQVIRLGFRIKDDPRADEPAAETIWGDPESRTEGEHVDAVVKMRSLEIPLEALWERAGATPQEIARWKTMRAEASLLATLGQSTVQTGLPEEPPEEEPFTP